MATTFSVTPPTRTFWPRDSGTPRPCMVLHPTSSSAPIARPPTSVGRIQYRFSAASSSSAMTRRKKFAPREPPAADGSNRRRPTPAPLIRYRATLTFTLLGEAYRWIVISSSLPRRAGTRLAARRSWSWAAMLPGGADRPNS